MGMWAAPLVVGALTGPIEKALAKYKRERAEMETRHTIVGADMPLERLNLIADGEMVPEDTFLQPAEVLEALRPHLPRQLAEVQLSEQIITADDFHAPYIPLETLGTTRAFRWRAAAFCERVVRIAPENPESPEAFVWQTLTPEERTLLERVATQVDAEDDVTKDDRQALAQALNRVLDLPDLATSAAFAKLSGTGDLAKVLAYLRGEAERGPLTQERQRRLNRLLLCAHFTSELRPPQMPLARVSLWKKAQARVQALNAQEAFMIWMKASFITGLVLASPFIFVNLWLFVAAGLYPHEKQYVHLYLPVSIGLFLSGAALAFGFVFEPVLDFLFYFNKTMNIDPDPRVGEWLNFVLLLPLAFGLSFQLPLVMLFLNRVGVVSVEVYLEHWRVALLVIAVVSMIITPGGDPYSLLLMMIPLFGLYFLGILMCRWLPRGRNPFTEVYEP
jgi:sec-independent protein translocase protein TatC